MPHAQNPCQSARALTVPGQEKTEYFRQGHQNVGVGGYIGPVGPPRGGDLQAS
jgi:hypothetical protein